MNFPNHLEKALTLSYDDAVEQDIRLISILDKHGIKGTFNINTGSFAPEGTVFEPGRIHRRMTEAASVNLYKNSGHEVAVHALTHPYLEKLPSNVVAYEVIEDRHNIERLFGTITRGMAYPYGTYSDSVVEVLKNCGICYARTVKTTLNFGIPTDWLRLHPTCHHKNPELMSLAEKFIGEKKPGQDPWLFYVWGHSYEFESDNNWNVIEEFAEKVGNRDDIWYATNIEIYDYINAWNSLIWAADQKLVHNPTSTTLFFTVKTDKYVIAPGETLSI
jgi:hypothetical protein